MKDVAQKIKNLLANGHEFAGFYSESQNMDLWLREGVNCYAAQYTNKIGATLYWFGLTVEEVLEKVESGQDPDDAVY
jgi:hypothetical protein